MTKQEVLDEIQLEITDLQNYYDSIKEGNDFIEQAITLGKIYAFLTAKLYVSHLDRK